MPFGLDIKSLILGALFALFVYPWIVGKLHRTSAPAA